MNVALIDEWTYLGFVLSCGPTGVMEGEQFISLHSVVFQVAYLCGRSMTAIDFSRRTNKNIETILSLRGRW